MKILFIIPSYKPAYVYGGTIVVAALLAEQLAQLGHEVTVYTSTANGKTELDVKPGSPIMVDGVKVIYFKRVTGDHTHASPAMMKHLSATIKQFDVIHIHSWWNLFVIGAAWVCKLKGVKPVISPHGMFSDYIIETNNSGKKKWIHQLLGKKLLQNSLLHVSTEMEWAESKKIIPGWEGMVVPNLVALSTLTYQRKKNEVFTIGFLSRVDPKKGLDVLIKALAAVNHNYLLKVAGSGDEAYVQSIKQLAEERGITDKIEWVGWKNSEEKFQFFSGLDLFALTSHSENFAVVVIEALSVGTPVMVSNNVGLFTYVKNNDYGWVTDMQIDNITNTLNNIINSSDKLLELNTKLPALIKKDFEYEILAKRYIELYNMAIK